MKFQDLKDGQIVRARWGRAGEYEPNYGPWQDIKLTIQKDNRGNNCILSFRNDWVEYIPKDICRPSGNDKNAILLCEDYYLEIDGLEG